MLLFARLHRSYTVWRRNKHRAARLKAFHNYSSYAIEKVITGLELIVEAPLDTKGKLPIRDQSLKQINKKLTFYLGDLLWAIESKRFPHRLSDRAKEGKYEDDVWIDVFFLSDYTSPTDGLSETIKLLKEIQVNSSTLDEVTSECFERNTKEIKKQLLHVVNHYM